MDKTLGSRPSTTEVRYGYAEAYLYSQGSRGGSRGIKSSLATGQAQGQTELQETYLKD